MTLFGKWLGIRGRPKSAGTPREAPVTPRGVARQMAESIVDALADPAGLARLQAIARLWRTPEEPLPEELLALDAFAAEFALDHVMMSEALRTRIREEFRAALGDAGVDLAPVLARRRDYAARLAADKQRALEAALMHSIADSVGAVFMGALGAQNELLADAIGRRFLDNTEALREYVEGSLRMMPLE